MAIETEIERIDHEGRLTTLPSVPWQFELELSNDPYGTMARIRGVVKEIAKQKEESWPDDDYWKSILPVWLIEFMPELSEEECRRLMSVTPREKWNSLPWQFGSWIDAMRERGWEWWGYEQTGHKVTLVLQIHSVPGRVEAFKQILLAAGAIIVKESY